MEAGLEAERIYAGLGRRALAMLIDNAAWLLAGAFLLFPLLDSLYAESEEAGVIGTFVLASAWFNYFALCEWRWGQTAGKSAVGIEVMADDARAEGESSPGGISFPAASMRNLLRLVDFFVVGWVLIARGGRRQRLGDKVAGTVVIERPRTAARTALPVRPADFTAVAPVPPGWSGPPLSATPYSGGPESPAVYASAEPPTPAPPPPGWEGAPLEPSAPPPAPPPSIDGATFPGWVSWGPMDVVKGMLAALVVGLLIAPLIVLPFDPDLDGDGTLLIAQALFGLTLIGVAIVAASGWKFREPGAGLRRLGLRSFAPSAFGWIAAVIFGYFAFAILFSVLIVTPEQEDIGEELGIGDETLAVAVIAVILIVVLAPVSEELFFRGFVYGGLRSKLSFWPALVIAGLIFGSIHAPTGITTVIPLAVLGGGFCFLYEKTGSVWPCMIGHAINNGIAVAAAGAEPSAFLPWPF
jgi:uncharacterized protein